MAERRRPRGLSALQWVAGGKTPPKVYITRVFNFGTWDEWCAMKKKFAVKDIEDAVRRPLKGVWTPRGRRFAEMLYECKIPDEALIRYEI